MTDKGKPRLRIVTFLPPAEDMLPTVKILDALVERKELCPVKRLKMDYEDSKVEVDKYKRKTYSNKEGEVEEALKEALVRFPELQAKLTSEDYIRAHPFDGPLEHMMRWVLPLLIKERTKRFEAWAKASAKASKGT